MAKKIIPPKRKKLKAPQDAPPEPKPQDAPDAGGKSGGTPDPGQGAGGAEAPADTPLDGPMTEQQIRDQGWMIDLPFESPDPGGADILYGDGDAEEWVPSDDFQIGGQAWSSLPPIDPALAHRLGLTDEPSQETNVNPDDGTDAGPPQRG